MRLSSLLQGGFEVAEKWRIDPYVNRQKGMREKRVFLDRLFRGDFISILNFGTL